MNWKWRQSYRGSSSDGRSLLEVSWQILQESGLGRAASSSSVQVHMFNRSWREKGQRVGKRVKRTCSWIGQHLPQPGLERVECNEWG